MLRGGRPIIAEERDIKDYMVMRTEDVEEYLTRDQKCECVNTARTIYA
jgi:hypothetical protein